MIIIGGDIVPASQEINHQIKLKHPHTHYVISTTLVCLQMVSKLDTMSPLC